ncbi:MAG: isochorismatase family protein [Desulfobacterales bacterium]|nr:MAG: isochorismatase family protein [Desulfobacterales bacterium]
MRHPFVAEREKSLLLIIDVQQAMLPVINGWQETVRRVNQLTRAADLLAVPILVTEHYKKGLGATIPEVQGEIKEAVFFQKEYFSACLEDNFLDTVRKFGRPQIVVAGMETHVCLLQTGLDLIEAGYQLQVVRNAAASRYKEDWKTALRLFRDAGAVITTAEIVIFQWTRRSNTAEFRQILPIVK